MKIEETKEIKTKSEAIYFAVRWQNWMSDESLSFGELLEWQTVLEDLANRFDLVEEFTENGII